MLFVKVLRFRARKIVQDRVINPVDNALMRLFFGMTVEEYQAEEDRESRRFLDEFLGPRLRGPEAKNLQRQATA